MDEAQQALVRSWLTKGLSDPTSARIVGEAPDGPLDAAIYHCQQAAEKAVKAFLVFRGVTPEKTHDIRKLVVEASDFQPGFNELVSLAAALTPYAWEFRYPDDLTETYPTREEFDEAYGHAQTLYDFVLQQIPATAHPQRNRGGNV
jgi:HEPN domain-containing protein